MLTKAMIMAAGVGSRLEHLSKVLPKPLVPVANVPAMDILINHLYLMGIKEIIANTFYKSEEIKNHYERSKFPVNLNFLKEKELSGTAGGVKKCQFFFDKDNDFLVMSGDGLTDVNVKEAYESHKKSGSIITIVTKKVSLQDVCKYGIIVTDENGYVESFQEKPEMKNAKSNLANTGIYIFNYKIFDYIPENTFYDFAKNVFPYIISNGIKINTYEHEGYWSDIGSIEQYIRSNQDALEGKIKCFSPFSVKTVNGKAVIGQNTILEKTTSLTGNCVIGNNCKIGKNVTITDSILWDNIIIKDGITLKNSVIVSNEMINNSVYNNIIEKENTSDKEKITV